MQAMFMIAFLWHLTSFAIESEVETPECIIEVEVPATTNEPIKARRCNFIPQKLSEGKNYIFQKIATTEGTTFIAVVYSTAQAITNFGWAFNWAHLGIKQESALIISESFGIATAGLCLLFGACLPCIVYVWNKRHPDLNQQS